MWRQVQEATEELEHDTPFSPIRQPAHSWRQNFMGGGDMLSRDPSLLDPQTTSLEAPVSVRQAIDFGSMPSVPHMSAAYEQDMKTAISGRHFVLSYSCKTPTY